jgi:flagellar hook-length control protein FliK
MSPVSSQSESANTLTSDAVSQVASTDKSGINADTSGLFAGQTLSDTTVKQTAQTQSTQATTKTDQPLHTRIIDQIVRDVKLIKLPQQNDLVVKLSPPELGTLRVQITQAEQGLTTQIQTSGEQVKGLLQAHLPALNQAFSDAGLKMDSVSVTSGTSFGSLMQDSPNGSAQQQQGGQRHHYASSQDANGNQTVANMPTVVTGGETTAYSWLA